jgi:hypothetical protein
MKVEMPENRGITLPETGSNEVGLSVIAAPVGNRASRCSGLLPCLVNKRNRIVGRQRRAGRRSKAIRYSAGRIRRRL